MRLHKFSCVCVKKGRELWGINVSTPPKVFLQISITLSHPRHYFGGIFSRNKPKSWPIVRCGLGVKMRMWWVACGGIPNESIVLSLKSFTLRYHEFFTHTTLEVLT